MTDIELLSKRAHMKAARAEAGFFDHPSRGSIIASIDHTLLSPASTPAEIAVHCEEALKYGFASVCVPITSVPEAHRVLKGSNVKVGTVSAFPLGTIPVSIKSAEILWALEHGADEVDAVLDLSAIRRGDKQAVSEELRSLREAASGSVLKVILEMPLINDTQVITTLRQAEQAGVDFVKTCTGFGGGVTFYHVALLRTAASDSMKVKAAGGIKTYADAEILKALGADRIGTSKAISFLTQKA
ncbi:MAG: deoxyribose-phosphate aldolase [Thermovirgaceae bacterium]|nr:deoxyribose-phosphate aldolase [Thermovirgaceae bacterium]